MCCSRRRTAPLKLDESTFLATVFTLKTSESRIKKCPSYKRLQGTLKSRTSQSSQVALNNIVKWVSRFVFLGLHWQRL